jgi:oligopeptide transport system permease protein
LSIIAKRCRERPKWAQPIPRRKRASPSRNEACGGTPLYRFARNRAAVISIVLFALIVLYCVIVPFVSPHDPNAVDFAKAYLPPSFDHPFGTDKFGRDLFTRVAVGGRISIAIGFAGTLVILAIGLVYGSLAGFLGGRVDMILMRFLDALYGLPYLPFAIITTQVLSPEGTATFWTMVAALTVASWLTTARIVRGQIVTLKQNDYVVAARAVGARGIGCSPGT